MFRGYQYDINQSKDKPWVHRKPIKPTQSTKATLTTTQPTTIESKMKLEFNHSPQRMRVQKHRPRRSGRISSRRRKKSHR